ncbi:DUF4344 domain-containing metallopeptidase [Streptomyces sp. NPDC007863]|uniref:DUF4344 domain-containing metallopeptidase n=1 Tax=Streptomyces sp. NPDC007863 TaxID=3154894 RepID=UPI003407BB49
MVFHLTPRRGAAALAAAVSLLFLGASPTPAAPSAEPGPGELVVSYEPAQTQEGLAEQEFLQENEVLESAAAHANSLIGLPHDIPLVGASCEEPNAYWDPDEGAIIFCYEYAALFRSIFTDLNTSGTPVERERATNDDVIGISNSTVFHELGHALISVYELPITGREEDAVDQLATLLLSEDPVHEEYAWSDIEAWGALALASEEGRISEDVAGEHSLNAQRFYNAVCWLYGSNPALYQGVVLTEANPDGYLPESRAVRCPDEYRQIQESWSTLLAPYLKSGSSPSA